MRCPNCDKELISLNKRHYIKCAINNYSYEEYRIQYVLYNRPLLTKSKLKFDYLTNNKTLPALKKEYNLDYKNILLLLKYYGIKTRSSKESNNLLSVRNSYRNTCLLKYGVDNVTRKNTIFYNKRAETIFKKYGVDNVFKLPKLQKIIVSDDIWLKKYGITYHQHMCNRAKKAWDNKTLPEKILWLKKCALNTFCISKLEKRISEMLRYFEIKYVAQFNIEDKFYDFKVENILLEVNGDYYHANPLKYSANDYVTYWGSHKNRASEIWHKDEIKKDLANKYGYDVVYIWERDINKCKNIVQLYDLYKKCLLIPNKF